MNFVKLQEYEVLSTGERIENYVEMETVFKNGIMRTFAFKYTI